MKFFDNQVYTVLDDKKKLSARENIPYDPESFKFLNAQGYGIYFTPNSFNGRRLKENIKKINAIYGDLDVAKTEDNLPQDEIEVRKAQVINALNNYCRPSVIIDSRNGIFPIWYIDEPSIEDEALLMREQISRGLVAWSKTKGCAGDNTHNIDRLIRLPGYYHNKKEPYLVKILQDEDRIWTLAELKNFFWSELKLSDYRPQQDKDWENTDPVYREIDRLDIRTVLVDAFSVLGQRAEFDEMNRLYVDGKSHGMFVNREGGNFLANGGCSHYEGGNIITSLAKVLGISNKDAFKRIVEKYNIKTILNNDESLAPLLEDKIETQTKNKNLTLIHIDDILKEELPPLQWVVDNLIPAGGITAISGSPGAYKSWLVLYMAVIAAQGKNFLDSQLNVSQMGSLYVDEENGKRILQTRLKGLNTPFQLPIYFSIYGDIKFTEAYIDRIIAECLAKGLKLVIFDSFVRFLIADVHNENDAAKNAGVANLFRKMNKAGLTVIFLHHHKKENGIKIAHNDVMRGSGDLLAMVDCHIVMEKTKEKDQNIITITQNKLREAKEMEPFKIELVEAEDKSVSFVYNKITDFQIMGMDREARKLVIELLADGKKMAKEDIAQALESSIGKVKVKAVVSALEKETFILSEPDKENNGGRPKKVFFLNESNESNY